MVRAKFDEQLSNLNQELLNMGTMIEERIQKAVEALLKQFTKLVIDWRFR